MRSRVICVGMYKTGTTTMSHALTILGYRVKRATFSLTIPILKGQYDKVVKTLRHCDAVADIPWFMIYKQLDERIPGSKFILTIRNEDNWFKSMCRHISTLRSAHAEWIFGRGRGMVKDHKENAIAVYRRHNQEVLDYFRERPDDLLVINLEDGNDWEHLCQFLGKDMPVQPFPHANKTDYTKDRRTLSWRFRFARHRLKNNFKIWYIDTRGYW